MYQRYRAEWLQFSLGRTLIRQNARPKLKRLRPYLRRPKTLSADSTTNQLLLWYHLFACESHIDAIATALGVLGGELEDFRTPDLSDLVDEMMP